MNQHPLETLADILLWVLIASLVVFLASGCATTPPDIPVCVEIHPAKGWCTHTISGTEFYVDDGHTYKFDGKNPQSYWQARPSMVLVPSRSWARLKTYIITQCKQTGMCDKEISSWERTIENIDKTLEAK